MGCNTRPWNMASRIECGIRVGAKQLIPVIKKLSNKGDVDMDVIVLGVVVFGALLVDAYLVGRK